MMKHIVLPPVPPFSVVREEELLRELELALEEDRCRVPRSKRVKEAARAVLDWEGGVPLIP